MNYQEKEKMKEELMDYMEKSINSKMQAYDKNLYRLLDEVKQMRSEIQPVVTAFTESEQYRMVWSRTGITIRKTATWIIVVVGATTALFAAFKYGLKLLLLK